jgi:hypothetical protein
VGGLDGDICMRGLDDRLTEEEELETEEEV